VTPCESDGFLSDGSRVHFHASYIYTDFNLIFEPVSSPNKERKLSVGLSLPIKKGLRRLNRSLGWRQRKRRPRPDLGCSVIDDN